MIKILIAEDEVLISEELNAILTSSNYDVIGIAEDYDAAIKIIKATPPDIALLDINMQGKEQGFEIAKYLKNIASIPYLFLSSYTDIETISKAEKLNPYSYITKPFSNEQVLTSIRLALAKIQSKEKQILIKNGINDSKIKINDILWVQSESVYINLYTKQKKFVLRCSLTTFLNDFKIANLTQIHRSYAINMNNVTTISKSFVHINGQKLSIARSYKKNVLQIFNQQEFLG